MGSRLVRGCAHRVSGFMVRVSSAVYSFGRKGLIQLRHGLDALHGPQAQAQLQHLRDVQRQAAVHRFCAWVESVTMRCAAGTGACPHTMR